MSSRLRKPQVPAPFRCLPYLLLLLRHSGSPRLNWQPLWWDEGYTVYFATENIRRNGSPYRVGHSPTTLLCLCSGLDRVYSTRRPPLILRTSSVLIGVPGGFRQSTGWRSRSIPIDHDVSSWPPLALTLKPAASLLQPGSSHVRAGDAAWHRCNHRAGAAPKTADASADVDLYALGLRRTLHPLLYRILVGGTCALCCVDASANAAIRDNHFL